MFQQLIRVFSSAWELLIDIPLPKKWFTPADYDTEEEAELVALAIPVVGLALGLAVSVAGLLLKAILSPVAAAIIFAVLAVAAGELVSTGRAFGVFVSSTFNWAERYRFTDSLRALDTDWRAISGVIPSLAGVFYFGVKLAGFGLIYHFATPFWAVAVFTLGFAAQGYLASAPSVLSGDPILPVHGQARFHLWLVAAFIMLGFIANPAATLVAFAAVFVGATQFRAFCIRTFSGIDSSQITLFGVWAELAVLITGILSYL